MTIDTIDTIDPRYRKFVIAVEPPLTDQQRRDIINAGKKPSTQRHLSKLTGPLTESDRQRIRARNRARKLARRANARITDAAPPAASNNTTDATGRRSRASDC